MILDAFKVHSLIFQIRYKEAFLLWDQAGKIASEMKQIWDELKVQNGTPNQQDLACRGCQVSTGLTQSTVVLRGDNVLLSGSLEKLFAAFKVWRSNLGLVELARISARIVFIKSFDNMDEVKEYMVNLAVVEWPTQKVFDQPVDSSKNVPDVMFRFEDEKSFTFVRIRAEERRIEVKLDPDVMEDDVEKNTFRVLIDFDRGNLGSVPSEKIKLDEWFKGYMHVMRRDMDKVIRSRS
jgi:hypothetical protein